MGRSYKNNGKPTFFWGVAISVIALWYCIDTKASLETTLIWLFIALIFIFLMLASTGGLKMIIDAIKKKSYESLKAKDNRNARNRVDSFDNGNVDLKLLSLTSKIAISKMLKESDEFYNKISWKYNNKSLYRDALYKMISDTKDFNLSHQFSTLYTDEYFFGIVQKYFGDIGNYIEERINYIKEKRGYEKYIQVIKTLGSNVYNYTLRKLNIGYFNTTNPSKEFIEVDNVLIENEMNYIGDILLTYSTITQIIFLEKKINSLSSDDEFYVMLEKMIQEVDDFEIVCEKSMPIYEEFYKSKLGFVDKHLYKVALLIINDKIKELSKIEKDIINYNNSNYSNVNAFSSIDNAINFWLETLAKDNVKISNIEFYLSAKITEMVESNNNALLIECLYNFDNWVSYYNSKVSYYGKERDKERYISGDFSKEKQAKAFKYSLINVETGHEFELYLQNLFRDLNYKVKHCGKSGDQGGDLVVKKGDITYVIQAKYYTNKLDNKPVQEVIGAIRFYNANRGVVITNSTFSKNAKELASVNRIILIDGKDLKKLTECIYDSNKEKDFLEDFIK